MKQHSFEVLLALVRNSLALFSKVLEKTSNGAAEGGLTHSPGPSTILLEIFGCGRPATVICEKFVLENKFGLLYFCKIKKNDLIPYYLAQNVVG